MYIIAHGRYILYTDYISINIQVNYLHEYEIQVEGSELKLITYMT